MADTPKPVSLAAKVAGYTSQEAYETARSSAAAKRAAVDAAMAARGQAPFRGMRSGDTPEEGEMVVRQPRPSDTAERAAVIEEGRKAQESFDARYPRQSSPVRYSPINTAQADKAFADKARAQQTSGAVSPEAQFGEPVASATGYTARNVRSEATASMGFNAYELDDEENQSGDMEATGALYNTATGAGFDTGTRRLDQADMEDLTDQQMERIGQSYIDADPEYKADTYNRMGEDIINATAAYKVATRDRAVEDRSIYSSPQMKGVAPELPKEADPSQAPDVSGATASNKDAVSSNELEGESIERRRMAKTSSSSGPQLSSEQRAANQKAEREQRQARRAAARERALTIPAIDPADQRPDRAALLPNAPTEFTETVSTRNKREEDLKTTQLTSRVDEGGDTMPRDTLTPPEQPTVDAPSTGWSAGSDPTGGDEYLTAKGLTMMSDSQFMATRQREDEDKAAEVAAARGRSKFGMLRTAASDLLRSATAGDAASVPEEDQERVADTIARHRFVTPRADSPQTISEETAPDLVGDANTGKVNLPAGSRVLGQATAAIKMRAGKPVFRMGPDGKETNEVALEKTAPPARSGQEVTRKGKKAIREMPAVETDGQTTPKDRAGNPAGENERMSRISRIKVLQGMLEKRQIASMTGRHMIASEAAATTGARPPMPLSLEQRLATADEEINKSLTTMASTAPYASRKRGADMAGAGSAERPGGRKPDGLVPKRDAGEDLPRIGEVERPEVSELRNKAMSMGLVKEDEAITSEDLYERISAHVEANRKGAVDKPIRY